MVDSNQSRIHFSNEHHYLWLKKKVYKYKFYIIQVPMGSSIKENRFEGKVSNFFHTTFNWQLHHQEFSTKRVLTQTD